MIDHHIDDEVSDEALEAAALVALRGLPTLPHTYCFACPSDPVRDRARLMIEGSSNDRE